MIYVNGVGYGNGFDTLQGGDTADFYTYTPPSFEVRLPAGIGDVRGWSSRAPGVERGYLVISMDGVTFSLERSVDADTLAAANFYALGGHETVVTLAQRTAIEAAGVGGTFAPHTP